MYLFGKVIYDTRRPHVTELTRRSHDVFDGKYGVVPRVGS